MHLHVSEIFEDLREKLNVTLCMGDFVLGCEKVKDRTDVLRGPGIVAFLNLVSNDRIEIIKMQSCDGVYQSK
jgi:hypothetical protein